jgi:hypothetical protein
MGAAGGAARDAGRAVAQLRGVACAWPQVWVQERRAAAPGSSRARGGAPETLWRCRAVGSYKAQRLGAAGFSADGSILAVAAGARATLWDADSHALAAALPTAAAPGEAGAAACELSALAFVPNSPFLAAASASCVAVYNLLTAGEAGGVSDVGRITSVTCCAGLCARAAGVAGCALVGRPCHLAVLRVSSCPALLNPQAYSGCCRTAR